MVALEPDPDNLAGLDLGDANFVLKFRTSSETSSRQVVLYQRENSPINRTFH